MRLAPQAAAIPSTCDKYKTAARSDLTGILGHGLDT